MKFVILTGMSGAGKSTALKMMEDIGFYCVDNLPIPLLEKFVELSDLQQNAELQKVAVGIDIRSGHDLGVAFQTHPGRQAFISSGSKEPRSALESRRVSLGAHWVDSRESSLLRRLERGREIGL